jgi:hypothetical protein
MELRNAAISLGAQFLGEGFQEICTHYLHFSSAVNETFKDFKLAKKKKKFIVSPRWLLDVSVKMLQSKSIYLSSVSNS